MKWESSPDAEAIGGIPAQASDLISRDASEPLSRLPAGERTPAPFAGPSTRIPELDLARGIAVALMILSHCVKGLLTFEMMPNFAIVPVHLLTKFSSSLFFTVFGITLCLYYLPSVGTPQWPRKRRKLWLRGLEILFWYKVLIIVQMFQIYPRETIIETLLFLRSSDFVEVLGFYALALLWIPLFLPPWKKLRTEQKAGLILVLILLQAMLGGIELNRLGPLKALVFEEEGFYTFGQVSRGILVLGGLWFGELIAAYHPRQDGARFLTSVSLAIGVVFFAVFLAVAWSDMTVSLFAVAENVGKHPPDIRFMSFSMGGAMAILGACFWGKAKLTRALRPLTSIGQSALQAFVFHIFVIFVIYRWLLDLRHNVSYATALCLTLLLVFLTSGWTEFLQWRARQLRPQPTKR